MRLDRRHFLATTAAAAGVAAFPAGVARAATARYTRYDATSPQGQAMLRSYAIAIDRMLKLPPTDPRNWFRNAFIHFMDCPHGNWWFYVWHRGYLGFFEQTVREMSGNPDFAFPYWDWTSLPQIPDQMFDGALTPVDAAFRPYTRDLDTFTAFIKAPLEAYWNSLSPAQRQQLDRRGYPSFDILWNGVTGYDPSTGKVVPGNQAFAATDRARYLSRDDPKLDPRTAQACSPRVIVAGLAPSEYYSANVVNSFTSSKTPSHNTMPGGATKFSVLEGQPHNLVHNYTGGVGPWDPGPYGNMTNFLSPVDPVFFLHHSNMDRLWDVWTRKQQAAGLPILPTDPVELAQLSDEPFLFFVRSDGSHVTDGRAADYLTRERFDYDYGPGGFGQADGTTVASSSLSAAGTTVAVVTLTRSADPASSRQFDVLINVPADVAQAGVDSPYYAGTVGFFGPPMHGMAHDAAFAMPLPQRLAALSALTAGNLSATGNLEVRLAPSHDRAASVPAIKAVTLHTF